MNCVGQDNTVHFLGMLFSLSFVLVYGAYLAYTVLSEELRGLVKKGETPDRQHWSTGLTWSQYGGYWSWALALDYRIGGVGLIALLTAPLAWIMFGYHVYLIWAGTTTNESSKWSEWRAYIDEGLVYKWVGGTGRASRGMFDTNTEPHVDWPIHSDQRLFRSEDGRPPVARPNDIGLDTSLSSTESSPAAYWKSVYGLYEIENLYDLGFWDNLKDVFWPG
ncbi:MAG: hypothetical protein LQ352_008028 [Teloschistes flavicans]|nr:MAG: hypothetical protein LQ352_008028 [Teloschistes flavicans]